jgi:hypothetical protein
MPEEPLTGIDEELRALLAVEPSPEFAARVRERISTEQAARGSWFAVGAWGTAVAAALLVAGVALWPSSEVLLPPPAHVVTSTVAPPNVEPADRADAGRGLPRPAGEKANASFRSKNARMAPPLRRVVLTPEPEVMVDARQTAGIQRVFDMVRAGTDLTPADTSAMHAPIALEPLRIPDLTIDSAGPSLPPGGLVPNQPQPAKE